MLRIRQSLRRLSHTSAIGIIVWPCAAGLASAEGVSKSPGSIWYHDGTRRVTLSPSADTLNVVLKTAYADAPPEEVLRYTIDRRGRHFLVRPPNMDTARQHYLSLKEVEAVQSVYYRSSGGGAALDLSDRLASTGRIAIRAVDRREIDGILGDFGLSQVRVVAYAENTVIATASDGADAVQAAQDLYQSGRVIFAVPQFAELTTPRGVPNDPFFRDEWHLRNTGQNGGKRGADLNVVPAWDTATGVTSIVAIVDDGVDINHPDLINNIDSRVSHDFNDADGDPSPNCSDGHGTGVAGISGATADNLIGVSGVAPGAALGAIRLTAAPFSDEDTADALIHRVDIVDVYNNSWGPRDDGRTLAGPGVLAASALEFGIRYGRMGRGVIYVWAGGNGELNGDDANFDGFVNSRYTIGVGASTNLGTASSYSESGACILVNAPSSGGLLSITTTDNAGGCGRAPGNYTFGAGGTSAAAPMVAGVVALMLEVNPDLSWRDVQSVLLLSATQNDPHAPGWSVNAAGLPIHPQLGFGRVNAAAAVELATLWDSIVPRNLPSVTASNASTSSVPIPDPSQNGVQLELSSASRFIAEHVEVTVDITHERRGDLELVLTSPSGTQSVLAPARPSDFNEDLHWTFMTVRNWGEPAEGTWTLTVSDRRSGAVGTVNGWELAIYGRHLDLPQGDLNGDGSFNSFDISVFFLAIFDPGAYTELYPGLDAVYLGDFDGDGALNTFDVPGFAESLFR